MRLNKHLTVFGENKLISIHIPRAFICGCHAFCILTFIYLARRQIILIIVTFVSIIITVSILYTDTEHPLILMRTIHIPNVTAAKDVTISVKDLFSSTNFATMDVNLCMSKNISIGEK